MKQATLVILACLFFAALLAQTPAKLLDTVQTTAQAEQFIESHSELQAELISISSDTNHSVAMRSFFDQKTGYVTIIGKYTYKILEVKEHPEFRASYIFLDGSHSSLKQIDSVRNMILRKIKNGASFSSLVNGYTMDGNPTGDLGWFTENMMVKDFEMAIREHKKGDLFTVDIPDKQWYYVCLKTFNDRIVKQLTTIKIKNSR